MRAALFGQSFYGFEITKPQYLEKTEEISAWLKGQSYAELKWLWGQQLIKLQNRILTVLQRWICTEILRRRCCLMKDLLISIWRRRFFEDGHFDYVQEHLRILSAFTVYCGLWTA